MNFIEYLISEARQRAPTGANVGKLSDAQVNAAVKDYISKNKIDAQINQLVTKLGLDIVQLRPDMQQTMQNWWGNVKKFGKDLWSGALKNRAQQNRPQSQPPIVPEVVPEWTGYHVYNAQLYIITEEYVTSLCNEADISQIQDLLTKFQLDIQALFMQSFKAIANWAYDNGKFAAIPVAKAEKEEPDPWAGTSAADKSNPPATPPANPFDTFVTSTD